MRTNNYISSDGTLKDPKTMEYTYLVNAIAKAFRTLNETKNKDEFIRNSDNICVLQDELLERNKVYFDENFGDKNEQ